MTLLETWLDLRNRGTRCSRRTAQPLRIIVVAPTPCRKRKSGKLYYRNPAYLFTTGLVDNAKTLLQIYFDRWQIEVNHREEKDTLGVGQAQLWNPTSVPRQPVLVVAAYSALLLAALLALGPQRTNAYATLPRSRRKEALLPRSHHPPSQGNERPPRNVHPPAHKRLIPEIGGLGCRMVM